MTSDREGKGEVLLYETPDRGVELQVRLEGDTLWLSQKQIAEVFGTKRPAITKHLANIFASGELDEPAVCSILEHTAAEFAGQAQAAQKELMIHLIMNLIRR